MTTCGFPYNKPFPACNKTAIQFVFVSKNDIHRCRYRAYCKSHILNFAYESWKEISEEEYLIWEVMQS